MRVDLYVHTYYSGVSLLSFEAIIATCQRRGIGCVAILEHSPLVEFS
jgi:predicted metal-dependent phosphoesterase TrpH